MKRMGFVLLILSGLLFLASSVSQYGITFCGPAGFVVPFGAIIMMGVGGWIWWQGRMEGEEVDGNNEEDISEEEIEAE